MRGSGVRGYSSCRAAQGKLSRAIVRLHDEAIRLLARAAGQAFRPNQTEAARDFAGQDGLEEGVEVRLWGHARLPGGRSGVEYAIRR